jgi:hypothetical protein
MKHLVSIIVAIVLLSCNGDNVPDCFQNSGAIIQQEFVVETFDKITVYERIELIVKDGPSQKVIVETGKYLLNDIEIKVENGTLILKNNNACNLTRDYGITKVYVSSSNLTEIRNSSGLTVSSDGVLNYSNLTLVSEDFNATYVTHTDGDFNLQVNCNRIDITFNNLSRVFISGFVNNLFIGFYSGDTRFEGANLIAQNIDIFQRSSNDMIVNPQQSLTGEIRGTGDVISLNRPPIVEVEEFYTGKLIFE